MNSATPYTTKGSRLISLFLGWVVARYMHIPHITDCQITFSGSWYPVTIFCAASRISGRHSEARMPHTPAPITFITSMISFCRGS